MKKLNCAMAVLVGVAAPFGQATSQTAGAARQSVSSMDVAGVRLNMTLAQVRSALAGTYTCSSNPSNSFSVLVADEVRKRHGEGIPWLRAPDGVGWLSCSGPNGERLNIELAQTATGPVVDRLFFAVTSARVDLSTVRARLMAKYGPITTGDEGANIRCDPGVRCWDRDAQGPIFSTSTTSTSLEIVARRAAAARAADAAAVAAAADRIAPRAAGAAF